MKKTLFYFLAAFLLMACNKNKDNEIVFKEPATKADAVSIAFDRGEDLKLELLERERPGDPASTVADQPVDVVVRTIDLTEDSRYILYICDKDTKAIHQDVVLVWTGRYKKSGETFVLEGIGDIRPLNGGDIVLHPASGVSVKGSENEYTIPATVTPITTDNTVAANLARSWKIESTYIKVLRESDKVSIAPPAYDGCNLQNIALDFKQRGLEISDADVQALDGYNVTELNIVGNDTVVMNFSGADSYYGTWDNNGNEFSWQFNDSNRFLAASASGKVEFPSEGKAYLSMDGHVTDNNENYTVTVKFTLVQAQ